MSDVQSGIDIKSRSCDNKPVVGNGINKGILMLLATPYVLIGTAGVFFYQYKRRQKYGK